MIAYTRHVTVYRRQGATSAQIHVDPRGLMGVGDTYDVELILPATAATHAAAPRSHPATSVAGVARGATASVGCALPQLPQDHCIAVHVCAVRVTIHHLSDAEDDDVRVLPVEIEHREMGLIGR